METGATPVLRKLARTSHHWLPHRYGWGEETGEGGRKYKSRNPAGRGIRKAGGDKDYRKSMFLTASINA